MEKSKPQGNYTTIPIKWETYNRWQRVFNKLRMEEKLKYQEEFINLLLNAFEK